MRAALYPLKKILNLKNTRFRLILSQAIGVLTSSSIKNRIKIVPLVSNKVKEHLAG